MAPVGGPRMTAGPPRRGSPAISAGRLGGGHGVLGAREGERRAGHPLEAGHRAAPGGQGRLGVGLGVVGREIRDEPAPDGLARRRQASLSPPTATASATSSILPARASAARCSKTSRARSGQIARPPRSPAPRSARRAPAAARSATMQPTEWPASASARCRCRRRARPGRPPSPRRNRGLAASRCSAGTTVVESDRPEAGAATRAELGGPAEREPPRPWTKTTAGSSAPVALVGEPDVASPDPASAASDRNPAAGRLDPQPIAGASSPAALRRASSSPFSEVAARARRPRRRRGPGARGGGAR